MSATSPALSNLIRVFNQLSYEPVLDSDSSIKSWVSTHNNNNGVLLPFVNGEYLNLKENQLNSVFIVRNPFNGDELAKVVNCDKSIVESAISSARSSLDDWKRLGYVERGKIIYRIARNVQKNLQLLTLCESLNSGRTSREVKDLDLANIVKTLYYYAGSSELLNSSINSDGYNPLGVVAIVGYFDSALLSLVNRIAAALATGNTCLIVPHRLTPLSAYMFLEICVQSGLPAGVVNLVSSDNEEILKLISSDPRVDSIVYDGRSNVAQEVLTSSDFLFPGRRNLFALEGKSSLVIYDSADIDSAIESAVDGCFYSNGQHRYSLNKLFIQENIYDDVLQRLEVRLRKLRVGNHLDKCNDYGSLLSSNDLKLLEEVLTTQTSNYGAEVIHFNNTTKDTSSKEAQLVHPILIKKATLNSPLNLNEINGPYLMLFQFRTVKESVDLLNTSKYGGGISLYSQNISLVMEVAYLLNTGTVWINSIPLERGVQVRKFSGNYSISGLRSLTNYLKPQFDNQNRDEVLSDLEEAKKRVKSFGSADSSVVLPSANKLSEEKSYKLYIGGKQTRPDTQSSRSIYVENKLYCLVAEASRKDVRNAVEAASSSFNSWWKRPNHNKSQILYFFGENFNSRQNEFVDRLEVLTRKSRVECQKEIKLCSDIIFQFASLCDKYIGNLNDTTEYGYLMELREPLGCIAIVCGHNSSQNTPLLSFILHVLAAIAYGNAVVVVPDELCPTPALDLYEVFETSDMPDGVINILSGGKHHLTKYLSEHQQVNAIWYLSDLSNDDAQSKTISQKELAAQQFIKYTSNFNLKQTWFVNYSIPLDENGSVNRIYLNELQIHSTQSKYVHLPMGVIFAN